MPRRPRILSSTGIYHVMMRGINKGDLFADDRDREKFLEIIEVTSSLGEYDIYAYCLMTNHIHLLIKETGDPIDRTMKRIGVSYSQHFNKRYERVGHVFQDRFRSETVENERYLLGCIRYIHNNPVKAGIIKQPEYYGWSSYSDYIGKGKFTRGITNTSLILGIFSDNAEKAVQAFREFSMKEDEKDIFIDYNDEDGNVKKEALQKRVNGIVSMHGLSIKELAECEDRLKRDRVLKELKSIKGASIRQLADILSIGKNIIYKA
ncbi:MAG: transposase [Lutispora sp.]|nr:transposase [Bacteroidales bacterium]